MNQGDYLINILEWDLTYTELMHWVAENNIAMDAINGYGRGPSTMYSIQNAEDYIAFKLKFAKEKIR